jgi:hypothetical protein
LHDFFERRAERGHFRSELLSRDRAACNAHSVPWRLIGEMVRATIVDSTVRIHHGLHEVTVHPLYDGRRHRVIDPAHFAGLAKPTTMKQSRCQHLIRMAHHSVVG